jgi:hypothetical protein
MMVGNGTSVRHDLFPGGVLYLTVHLNWIGDALVLEAEVHVDGCPSIVDLSDSEGDEGVLPNLVSLALLDDLGLNLMVMIMMYILTQLGDVLPGY